MTHPRHRHGPSDEDRPPPRPSPPHVADDDADEPAGDIATAVTVINALSGTQPLPPDAFERLLARADHGELLRGLATLILGFTALFPRPLDIVAPVVRRLRPRISPTCSE